jgi:large subunit ribosomal protein L30
MSARAGKDGTKAQLKKASPPGAKLKLRMIGSLIGCPEPQRATVRGLGLRRIHQVVERPDTPEIRGMVKKVPHLVTIVT